MPWFKVDDNLGFHHKVIAAGNAAMGLWVRAGSVCAQQLTDGFVPDHMVSTLGTVTQATKLVEVGLWDRVPGGFSFHGWDERQPSRADVEAERAAAAERMRAYRKRKRKSRKSESPQVAGPRSDEQERSFGVGSPEVRDVFGDPDPTRPDPTLVPTELVVADKPARSTRKKPATKLPDDWKPTEAHWERRHDGIDIETEAEKFRLHAEANDRRQVNWNAAFSQWLLNARPTGGNNVRPIRPDSQGRIQLPPLPKGIFE